ncbi:SirB1 family protein [Pseudidiomarina sp. CB1]|uniref:SirB1 family protein n=1 Tax=Pseudidiomarina sp. CB1 TaxID=2972484 RepID=UPI002161375A|nr:tetratricopeptide repeat protein [Pseudidiomarina sp. CB1]
MQSTMRFSYLEHVEHELLPTIEILWEVSRVFHADSDHYVSSFYQQLSGLKEHSELTDLDGVERLRELCRVFYWQLGFSKAPEQLLTNKRVLVDRAIRLRTGEPFSLALLLQEAANYFGLELELIDFPDYPLLRFDHDQHSYFVDPSSGDLLLGEQVQERFEDATEGSEDFSWDKLEAAEQKHILVRYLSELKHAFISDRRFADALTTVHMLLTILPDDPYEIRDRGYILEELDCNHVAVDDYQYFVEQCPDDPSAQLLRLQLENWTTPQTVLH